MTQIFKHLPFSEKIGKALIPNRFWYLFKPGNDRRYWWLFGVPRARLNRQDLVSHDIETYCHLEVYWVKQEDDEEEEGPVAILVVHGREVLKFDCYGKGKGHLHFSKKHPHNGLHGLSGRFLFHEETVEAQIERGVFELTANLKEYLESNSWSKVRRTVIDVNRMEEASNWMRSRMLALEKTRAERQGRKY